MKLYKRKYQEILESKAYKASTINSYIRRLELYENWCNEELQKEKYKIINSKAQQNRLLAYNYLKFFNKKMSNSHTVNRELQPLRLYYTLLNKENYFQGFYVRKKEKMFNYLSLSKEQLERLYDDFPIKTNADKRNKIILGFFVYQGVKSNEVRKVLLNDIDMSLYTIYLEGSTRINPRKISLHIKQILLLEDYIENIRKEFVKQEIQELFVTSKGSPLSNNSMTIICNKLRKEFNYFESLNQIRTSVIRIWLKEYDLRKVQFLCGHKYISSTEKFIEEDLQELQADVNKYFPTL